MSTNVTRGEPRLDCRLVESAEDLIDVLSLGNLSIKGENEIYRGQANAAWGLIPSAFRTPEHAHPQAAQVSHLDQMRRELSALKLFCDGADTQGLMIPGFGSQELVRTAIADGFSWLDSKPNSLNDTFIWPKDSLLPALALAQHNGVKTRLLDYRRLATTIAVS